MSELNDLVNEIIEFLTNNLENNSTEELSIMDELTQNYKEVLDMIDDCTFLDIVETLKKYGVDLKVFDELLSKEDRTELDNLYLAYLINFTFKLIRNKLENKIEQLQDILSKMVG